MHTSLSPISDDSSIVFNRQNISHGRHDGAMTFFYFYKNVSYDMSFIIIKSLWASHWIVLHTSCFNDSFHHKFVDESKGLWPLCITLRIARFLDFVPLTSFLEFQDDG